MASPIHKCRISTKLTHSSKFLGFRLRNAIEGERAEIAVDIENLGDSFIRDSRSRIEIEWSDGTMVEEEGQFPPLLGGAGAEVAKSKFTFGPFPIAIHRAGVFTVFLMLGLTVSELMGSEFIDAEGRKIVYEVYNTRLRVASFIATSRGLLYQKLGLVVGFLTLVTVILTRVFFR